jgi:hypothetical protein
MVGMKRVVFFLVCLAVLFGGEVVAFGQKTVHVRSYTKKDGTQVRSHYRSAPGTASGRSSSSGGISSGGYVSPPPVYSVPPLASQTEAPSFAVPTTGLPPVETTPAVRTNLEPVLVEVPQPVDLNLEYQKQHAAKGVPESMYAFGMRLLTGNGVPIDKLEGRKLVEAAAEQGNLKAREKRREFWEEDRRKKSEAEKAVLSR